VADEIEVTFIDAATGERFERIVVPATQLPNTFELQTTLSLGDVEWSVESATPPTRAEYERTKTLVLHLRKIERVDPKSILFSLPTIENTSPAAGGDPTIGDELVMHEDDWRQLELISLVHEDILDEELDAIADVRLNHAAGVGFKKIYVRSRIPHPIQPGTLALSDLGNVTGRAVALAGAARRVENSFVIALGSNTSLYGIAENGDVRVLALRIEGAVPDEALNLLERLQREHDLIFVDWCSCRTGMRAFFQA
jgi:hypothetical protein